MTSAKSTKTQDRYDRIHVVKKGKQTVADMVGDPPEGSVKMTITPERAIEMLALNTRNRPLRNSKVSLYARQMKSGDWRYTREPIIFSDQGRVIDGQHRLFAVVEAGVAIIVDVAFGAPDDAFAFIDVGAGRSRGDIFAINGVKNPTSLSGMTKMVMFYDSGRYSISSGGSVTAAELYDHFLTLPELPESLHVFHKFQGSRLASPTLMAALHYICARKCRADADEFFSIINEGGRGNSPAHELHRRLVRSASDNTRQKTDHLAGLVLTAWNRQRRGLSGRGLSFDGGKLPAVM